MSETNSQAVQYLRTIVAPPVLTPAEKRLIDNPSSGSYISYTKSAGPNVQGTNTGPFTSYVGGTGPNDTISVPSPDPNIQIRVTVAAALRESILETFPQITNEDDLEAFFNSMTTANSNAVQYVTDGPTTSPYVTGATTANSSLTNQALISIQGTTLPTSFTDFVSSMVNFLHTKYPSISMPANVTTTPMYKYFLSIFKQYTQSNTDWGILGSATNPALVPAQFDAAFSAFLRNFPSTQIENLQSDGTYNLVTSKDFLMTWLNFTTGTSTLESSTQNVPITLGSSTDANQYLLNYQAIYKAFFPASSAEEYQTFFTKFYNQILSDPANGGYFLPSQFVGKFFDAVKAKYIAPTQGQNSQFNLSKPILGIIWEVLARIQQMVNIIQQLSVYVSQYLTFLTHYQTAYTNLIATIPTIASGTDIVGGTDTVETRNTQLGNYRTTLASYRDQITATSKGAQSYLDTLSQASSNSLNQGGALITMLNGLLTIIHAS